MNTIIKFSIFTIIISVSIWFLPKRGKCLWINPSSEIVEEKNYYPFGLKHKGYNGLVSGQEYLYTITFQRQELHYELGLNWI